MEDGSIGGPKDRKAWTVPLDESTDFHSEPVGDYVATLVYNGSDGKHTWVVSRCTLSGSPLNTQVIRWDNDRNDISFL